MTYMLLLNCVLKLVEEIIRDYICLRTLAVRELFPVLLLLYSVFSSYYLCEKRKPPSHIKWLDVSSNLMHVTVYFCSSREKPQWRILKKVRSNVSFLSNHTNSV